MQVYEGIIRDRLTYRDLGHTVRRFAAGLLALGVGPGDRVVLLAENRPEWGIAYLGIVTLGAIVVPFDVQYTADEVQTLIKDCDPHLLIVTDGTRPLVSAGDVQQIIVTLDERVDEAEHGFRDLIADHGPAVEGIEARLAAIDPNAVASLLYTSGTTGNPKGVLLSHRNLLSNADAITRAGLATEADNILSILPLHHAYPFMVSFLIPLLLGARITFLKTLKGPELLACVRDAAVTVIVGVPQVFAQFHRAMVNELEKRPPLVQKIASGLMSCSGIVRDRMNKNIGRTLFPEAHARFGSSLRLLISGGARLDPDVARFLYRMGFTVLEGYGLSETSPILTFNPLTRQKIGSVGRPMEGVEIGIGEQDASGVGEVVARGPNVMLGYFRNDEATAEIIRDGALWTGDLGYVDQDGYLFLTGRRKELIVLAGGKNVYPEDVEAVYQLSPAMADVCVIGIERPGQSGDALHAVVYPDFTYFKAQKIGNVEETIRSDLHGLSGKLSPYKRVTGMTVVKEPLPRTRLGKLQRHRVRALVEAAASQRADTEKPSSDSDRDTLRTEPGLSVAAALKEVLGGEKVVIHLDDHLGLDLGIDSLQRIEMVVALERYFGRLPESFASEVSTMREVIEQINALNLPQTAEGAQVRQSPGESSSSWAEILSEGALGAVRLSPHARKISWQHRLQIASGTGLLHLVARMAFRATVSGLEHIPQRGPCLLAANHASFMDAFVVSGLVPNAVFDRLFFLGWEQYFRDGIAAGFAKAGHIVPVNTETHLVQAMQVAASLLRRGKMVMIFPEGCRTLDGALLPFRKGVGVLAAELSVPVVPVWINGTYEAWPVGQTLPKPGRVTVSFGKPVYIDASERQEWKAQGKDEYELATQRIRDAVLELEATWNQS